jgi:DNA-binding SARP family transcriptional activator
LLPFETLNLSARVRGEAAVEFHLLGPVEVSIAGCLTDAGRPLQRVVLAALLVDAGRPVPAEVLIDRAWGDAPPSGVRRTLHAHLSRVRRLLERDRAQSAPLLYRSGAYLLDIDPQAVDIHRFRRLVISARRADCADLSRAQRLREALQLWRSEPLAGLPGDWAVRTGRS